MFCVHPLGCVEVASRAEELISARERAIVISCTEVAVVVVVVVVVVDDVVDTTAFPGWAIASEE